MGGAAGINLLLGMVRVKFAALLIGTTGVGLIASFTALQGLIGTLAGLGIQSSAVREIAVSVGKGDEEATGRKVLALRRICWFTGIIGMAAMMLMSPHLSQLTFGHRNYTPDIAALGFLILFGNISGGQMALIQGMRRIGDMARANIYGAAAGTLAAIGFYAALGVRGIIPTLVTVSAIQLALSWYFARQVHVPPALLTLRETFLEAKSFITLGIVFTWSALMASGTHYLIVSFVTQQHGESGLGLYSAAFSLSALFINFILQAMEADYYPRLSAESENNLKINRLANEQIQIGLLIATPGLIATIIYAELAIKLFYTVDFLGAVALLQVFVLGCFGRVVGWPTGFIILAKKKDTWFFFTQTFYASIFISTAYVTLSHFGLMGVAISFCIQVFIGIGVNRLIVGYLTDFKWHNDTIKTFGANLLIIVLAYFIAKAGEFTGLIIGTILIFSSIAFTARQLSKKLGADHRITTFLKKSVLFSWIIFPFKKGNKTDNK